MKKLFIFSMVVLLTLGISSGFTFMPKTNFVVSNDKNPRGEKRPHDGRGNSRSGKGFGKNQGECNNPNKGPGYGRGNSRGNGKYRK